MLVGVRLKDDRALANTGILVALALAIGLSGVTATASSALEPGVHADPGSPAAKEYALPLAQARQTGSPREGGLFGAGIRRMPSRPAGSHNGSSGGLALQGRISRAGKASGGSRLGGRRSASEAATSLPAGVENAARARASSGTGSLLALLGGGVAVLALGALGGTILRGRTTVGTR
jgi:hypothetical protein